MESVLGADKQNKIQELFYCSIINIFLYLCGYLKFLSLNIAVNISQH